MFAFISLTSGDADLINDKELFPDLPTGCLDHYRKLASFDYRKLALLIEREEWIRYRVNINAVDLMIHWINSFLRCW